MKIQKNKKGLLRPKDYIVIKINNKKQWKNHKLETKVFKMIIILKEINKNNNNNKTFQIITKILQDRTKWIKI